MSVVVAVVVGCSSGKGSFEQIFPRCDWGCIDTGIRVGQQEIFHLGVLMASGASVTSSNHPNGGDSATASVVAADRGAAASAQTLGFFEDGFFCPGIAAAAAATATSSTTTASGGFPEWGHVQSLSGAHRTPAATLA